MSKKYRIVLERNECIGAGPCTAIIPEFWTLNEAEDGRVDIAKAHNPTRKDNGEQEIIVELTPEQLEEHKEAAESCPVNVIHIFDDKTGEKLI